MECWGRNWFGELGDGTAGVDVFRAAADFVSGLKSGVVSIATGAYYSCAALADGRAKCWGRNGGRLGDGTTTNRSKPVSVRGLRNATQVSAAGSHTCALTDTGAAKCWGTNAAGELGNGSWAFSLTPVGVKALRNAAAVAAGSVADWAHTCAALVGGGAKCWGDDGNGQLGDGAGDSTSNTPVKVLGLN
jgi:alpha-tubulin suppressor-like RCC1 family protein